MRHRSHRPLLDILRRLPSRPRFLGRFASIDLTPRRLVVALAAMLAIAGGGAFAVSELVERSPGPQVATGRPADSRSGADVSPDDGRTPMPPPRTPSPVAVPPDQLEVSRLATLETGEVVLSSPVAQPDVRLAAQPVSPSSAPSQTPTEVAADDTSPETYASTSSSDADTWVVSFSANEPSSFECSLDDGAFLSCASPLEYTGLDPGVHTFSVRATDAAGNLDESPATLRRQTTGKVLTAK